MIVLWMFGIGLAVAIITWALLRMLRDAEQTVGFFILVFGIVALATPIGVISLGWAETLPATGASLSILVIVTAVSAASTYWTRAVLRWFAALAVVLVCLLLIAIGRSYPERQAAETAIRELVIVNDTLSSLEKAREATSDELTANRESAILALDEAIRGVGTGSVLPVLAERVYRELLSDRLSNAQVRLEVLRRAYRPSSATESEVALRDAAVAAVAAAQAAESEPSPTPVNEAIEAACAEAVAVDNAIDAGDIPCADEPRGDTLEVAMATVRLELATYRQSVLGRDQDEAEVATLTEELAETQAAAKAQPADQDIFTSLRNGVDGVVADLPGQRADFPVVLGALAWTLLAVLLLAWWRVVERRSAQQMSGPVEPALTGADAPKAPPAAASTQDKPSGVLPTPAPTSADAGKAVEPASKDTQLAIFRAALLQNLPEPTMAPGSEALSSVTDLTELTTAATLSPVLAKIGSAIRGILVRPTGYKVSADVLAPDRTTASDSPWNVLVRIVDQSTGEQVAVQTVTAASSLDACRAAGYWAAAAILGRSTRIPGWARWEPTTAESLAAYQRTGPISTTDLETAVAGAPTSGLLLNTLANQYDFEERHLPALVLYARAVTAHPRFFVARYRMAVSLTMVGHPENHEWSRAPLSERSRIGLQLQRACDRLGMESVDLNQLSSLPDDAAQATLKDLAERMFEQIDRNWRWLELIGMTFSRSERAVWWPHARSILRRFGSARRDRWLVRSALLIEDARKLEDVRARARNPKSWWQLSYNLACFYAREGMPDEALSWLEAALERPGCQQMAGGWISKDPDLTTIRDLPRFQWIVRQVASKEGIQRG